MDRGAWRAAVHGVSKVENDLATKQQKVSMDTEITAPFCRIF